MLGHGYRDDLRIKEAFIYGRHGPLLAAQRPAIHLFTGNSVLGSGDAAAVHAHMDLVKGAPEPIFDQPIDDRAIPHAQPIPHPRQQVRNRAHILHPPADNQLRLAAADKKIAQVNRP